MNKIVDGYVIRKFRSYTYYEWVYKRGWFGSWEHHHIKDEHPRKTYDNSPTLFKTHDYALACDTWWKFENRDELDIQTIEDAYVIIDGEVIELDKHVERDPDAGY